MTAARNPELAFGTAMDEAGILEGGRRVRGELGIRTAPQPSRPPARHLQAVPDLEAEP